VRAKDDFVILKESTDSEKYKLKLLSCFLYIPVAQLSSSSFNEIERVLTTKSVAIHYRKIEIRNITLVKGKEEYNSENLFTSDCPCRIVICFIESKNNTGAQDLNPFDFKRKWTYTPTLETETTGPSERERYLEEKLLDFEKQLAFFKSCVTLVNVNEQSQPAKNKGRGKRSQPSEAVNSSFFDRFRPNFSNAETQAQDAQSTRSEAVASSSRASTSSAPPPYENVTAEKTVYIKQVDLLLNGSPLDQLSASETGKYWSNTY